MNPHARCFFVGVVLVLAHLFLLAEPAWAKTETPLESSSSTESKDETAAVESPSQTDEPRVSSETER